MRIARTTGVSDAIVKPRRGISLRPKREEPKPPEKRPYSGISDLAEALKKTANTMGSARFAVDSMMDTLLFSNTQTMQFRTEEVPEDRRVTNYDARDLRIRHHGLTDFRQLVNDMAGRVPDGYTRTIDEENGARGHFFVVEDYRPRSMRRIPQPLVATDFADPRGDYSVIDINVSYEMVEDVAGATRHRELYDNMPIAFWREVVRRTGRVVPDGFDHVDVYREIRDRTFNIRFSTRGY
jgi:hypothetical protein